MAPAAYRAADSRACFLHAARPRRGLPACSAATALFWRPPAASCPPVRPLKSAWRPASVSAHKAAPAGLYPVPAIALPAPSTDFTRCCARCTRDPTPPSPPTHPPSTAILSSLLAACSHGAVPCRQAALPRPGAAQAGPAAAACRNRQTMSLYRQPLAHPRRALPTVRCAVAAARTPWRAVGGPRHRAVHPAPALLNPCTRHACSSRRCLLSKCYSGAGRALDADVYIVDPAKTAVAATDVLLYCYYGASLEIGRCRPQGLRDTPAKGSALRCT